MKSCGSWSSGFPVNEHVVMSAMSTSSGRFLEVERGSEGEFRWLFLVVSCGVQVAGEKLYCVDVVEVSVKLDDSSLVASKVGEVLRVAGTKRSSSSLSIVAMDLRGASLDQGVPSVS